MISVLVPVSTENSGSGRSLDLMLLHKFSLEWPSKCRIKNQYAFHKNKPCKNSVVFMKCTLILHFEGHSNIYSVPSDELLNKDKMRESIGNLTKVDFFWINRDQKSFEWFYHLLTQLGTIHKLCCTKYWFL